MQSLEPWDEILQKKGIKRRMHFLDSIIFSIYMENKKIKMKMEKNKKIKKHLDDCTGLCVCQTIQVVT